MRASKGAQTISSHYDPMIAKLIATGRDREEALARIAGALEEFTIAGIRTGLPFLRRACENPVFQKGAYDTAFIENEMADGPPPLEDSVRDSLRAAVALRASNASGGTERRFEIALPKTEKTDPVQAEVVSNDPAEGACVRLGDREMKFVLSNEDNPVVMFLSEGGDLLLTLVPRKKGGFDVGLRDRVLRVKCTSLPLHDS